MYPENATTAATADADGDISLEPAAPEIPKEIIVKDNITTGSKTNTTATVKANATKTVTAKNAAKAAAPNITKKPIEEPEKEAAGKSGEQMLNDVLLSGLN